MGQQDLVTAAKAAAAKRRALTRWQVYWRSTADAAEYATVDAAAAAFGLSVNALKAYLSRGRGKHSRKLRNPTTGEADIATMYRVDPPAKERAKPGRKPSPATLARRAANAANAADATLREQEIRAAQARNKGK